MTDLGTPLGGSFSRGYSINASGQVTGDYGIAGDGVRAFLYSGGSMYDLTDLVSHGLPDGVILDGATGINDSGWIIANGRDSKAYLLQPVPEPASLALFLIAAGALAVLRMCHHHAKQRMLVPDNARRRLQRRAS